MPEIMEADGRLQIAHLIGAVAHHRQQRSSWQTLRAVWLLPQPVRIATTAITGTADSSIVRRGPSS